VFKRILIANRGEIALRVIRACKEMGIATVAVYSEEDRDASYLALADRAVCIGPANAADSYLKADRIIAASEISGADAIHPGYGFLAENAQFAEQCRGSKVAFIGPTAESMRLLGDKASARTLAKKAKVPVVPGSEGIVETEEQAAEVARTIGYPVMIKATGGGGGRGMRIARAETELRAALEQSRQEAMAAFKNPGVYIEKFIDRPRHIEVQVIADHHGHIVHLYERDCTLQRRYQKLVEESPSPALDPRRREELCKAAVRLCKAAQYTSVGTIEFIVDQQKKFYFIEANTRIQVEHPVTEMVTGIDLIKAQIAVAAGQPLPFSQRDVQTRGAAIECRLNAEDPDANFRPCAGIVETFRPAGGFGVRVDSHVHDGYRVSPRYDSLLGKLIVHQPDRTQAIATMLRCLDEFVIEPIKTTLPLYRRILLDRAFRAGDIDTGYVDRLLGNGR